jgi:hypothetical protein
MNRETKQAVRTVVNLAVFAAVVWYSLPNRPPLTPYVWRTGARISGSIASGASTMSLWCRSRYWKAVRS